MIRSRAAAAIPLLLLCITTDLRADSYDEALAAVRTEEARRIETFARAARAVVCIFDDQTHAGGGSGVIIDERGYGLTNFHVVQAFVESRRGFGGLDDGRLYSLRVIGIDPGGDIALFKLEGRERFDCAPLGDSEQLHVGQSVAAMGNPFGLAQDFRPTITFGTISGLHRYQEGQGERQNLLEYADCIQVSTSINPGNSGGPLFDLTGHVVGINGRASFEERGRVNVGLGYAVSINQIKRFIPSLLAGRMVAHGTLGITVREAGDDLIVDAIQGLSPAERAGMQLGDELIAVAGRQVRTANDYNNILTTLPADWPAVILLRRGDEKLTLSVRLERTSLGVPINWLPNLDHNHRELLHVFDEHARRSDMRAVNGAAIVGFSGRIGGAPDAERGPWSSSISLTQAADSPAIDAITEWPVLARPLAFRPEPGVDWELLGGDEVNGRIVFVVQHELGNDRQVRWMFDADTFALVRVAFGDADNPQSVTWTPDAQTASSGWPTRWVREAHSGDVIELELTAVEILSEDANLRSSPASQPGGGQ